MIVEIDIICSSCLKPISLVGPVEEHAQLAIDGDDGKAYHLQCLDMERSANFGDYITREYEL